MGLRFLTAKKCGEYICRSDKHWYHLVKTDPAAPKPVIQGVSENGRRFSCWLYHEVQKYMRVLIRENRIGYQEKRETRKEDAA